MGHDDELFKKAEVALKKHNYEYAIELVLQGLLINPKATEWRRRLHQIEAQAIHSRGGNPQGGFGNKLKVLPHQSKAKKLHLQKKYDEEVIELEKVLRHQPHDIGSLFALANALQLAEMPQAAISTYREVIELNNTHIEAYRRLGKLVGEVDDDPEQAIEYWEKVKQFKPDDKEAGKAIRDLSAATMVRKAEERKQKGGDESFRSMLKDEEESEELQKKQQIIRNDADRVRAIKFKVEEIKKDPENTRLYRELGGLYQDLKKWDMAEKVFRKALQINSQDLAAKERLGVLGEKRFEAELDELRARAEGSEDEAIRAELEGKESEFLAFKVKEYKRRVEEHPTDYALKLAYGQVLKASGKYDEAIGQFQQSVKDPKHKVNSKKEIGECFMEKGLFDMAAEQFAQAIEEVAEKESSVWKGIKYDLARACEENDDLEDALRHYQEIMSVDISFKDISSRVGNLRKRIKAQSS